MNGDKGAERDLSVSDYPMLIGHVHHHLSDVHDDNDTCS